MKSEIDVKSERNQRQIGYLALSAGGIGAVGGFFGLWMQGRIMYDGQSLHMVADVLIPEDIFLSICLPALVIAFSGLLLSWVILMSKLTEEFSPKKRNILFTALGCIFLIGIIATSKIAADQDWARARAGADYYWKNLPSNSPGSLPAKPQKPNK